MAKRPLDRSVNNPRGNYIFADFSGGLYLLDTPRSIGEQLATLALVGGRNVWAEKGALIPQYGYVSKGSIDADDKIVAVTKDSLSSSSFFLIGLSGKVYYYTAWQGLKKYKTTLPQDLTNSNPMCARRGDNLVVVSSTLQYQFGSYYQDSAEVVIEDSASVITNNSTYIITVDYANKDYYWNTKRLLMKIGNSEVPIVITAVQIDKNNTSTITLRAVAAEGQGSEFSGEGNVSLIEKASKSITMQYNPEDTETGGGSITIIPKLIGFANNRLIVTDESNTVYYSQVGVIDDAFNQKYGAGYVRDFYQDISSILDFEDFLGGCLIFRENGIYFMKITQTSSGTSTSIEKIAQIGQQYASDHVVVREKVYAYDSNSGSIVVAAAQNVFGSLVAGKTIVTNEYLNSQDFGINDTKRFLTYNAENEVLILYYGENLNRGIVILDGIYSLFPRELDKQMFHFLGFNQGIAGITQQGEILQDFKKGTVISGLTAIANFEPIGLRDNRIICNSIVEVTELNGVSFNASLSNSGYSYQKIVPSNSSGILTNDINPDSSTLGNNIPLMLYSDYAQNLVFDRFSMEAKWAGKQSNVTRIYAPMSGKEGVSIGLEFPANEAFCLAALRLADFSQGE